MNQPNPHELPGNLPVPRDDGAADRLPGAALPPVVLEATGGKPVDLAAASDRGFLVLYVYPRTGVPGEPMPRGWDRIPGARGCTPQSCAFRDSAAELADLGVSVLGLSAQPLEEQVEFAKREHLPYPLLNDSEFRLAATLRLPTFEADGARYYRRLTLIARNGRIEKVFYPVLPPQDNAADVIAWIRTHGMAPEEWTIRAAGDDDVAAVLDLWRAAANSRSATDSEEGLERLLRRDARSLLVAEAGGAVVGSLIAGWDGWRGSFYRLVVHPDWRRRGVATSLVRAGETHLEGFGAIRLTAIVTDEETDAPSLWQAMGYVRQAGAIRFVRMPKRD